MWSEITNLFCFFEESTKKSQWFKPSGGCCVNSEHNEIQCTANRMECLSTNGIPLLLLPFILWFNQSIYFCHSKKFHCSINIFLALPVTIDGCEMVWISSGSNGPGLHQAIKLGHIYMSLSDW